MSVLFAKHVLQGPLCEFTQSVPMKTQWVSDYTLKECKPHIENCIRYVSFLQRGPSWELFAYLIKNRSKVSIVNTEQMTRYNNVVQGEEIPFPFDLFLMRYIRSGHLYSIVDYSAENMARWKALFYNLRVVLCCFKNALTCVPPIKSKNVVFVGDTSSRYRQFILQQVKPDVLVNCYGLKRDEELYQYRILLNVHFGKSYTIFEELRCLPCVLACMVVVSEKSNIDKNHPLYPFIFFASYSKLPNQLRFVEENYKTIWKVLYENNPMFTNLLKNIQEYENLQNKKIIT